MIEPYTLYDPSTGRILGAGEIRGADEDMDALRAGFDTLAASLGAVRLVVASDMETDYVDLSGPEPVITPRPSLAFDKTLIAADGSEEAVLAGLPIPATVTVNGEEVTVTDGSLEIVADGEGAITVTADLWPYLSLDVTLYGT